MKVVFRNFFRNKTVNLTMKSVRHFCPEAEFHCVSFFKVSEKEYDNEEPLDSRINNRFIKTKYVNSTGKPADSEEDSETSGYGNTDNTKYFSEGYNVAFNLFKDFDGKVLILAEDHFFTTGAVLKEVTEGNFDMAVAAWGDGYNGSIICINPKKMGHLFPMIEEAKARGIEGHLKDNLVYHADQDPALKVYRLKNRSELDYFGDGFYTNSSKKIEEALKAVDII